MTAADEPSASSRSRRTRTLIVSFLGSVVRQQGDWMPIAGTIELLSQLGVDAPSVRTGVFRLKQRGWLEAETRDGARGYTLTDHALGVLADGDEVIWHARRPAALDDGWCIVNFSVPESDRSKRYKLRTHLSQLGFGNVGTAMWLAPARMQGAAESAIAELGLDKYAAVFVGSYAGTQDLTSLLYDSWDLAGIDRSYRDFIERHERITTDLEPRATIEPQQAFTAYLSMIDDWRQLPFRDPGLPREVLADDWSGPEAVALFERLVHLLEDRALSHAARFWGPVSEVADEPEAEVAEERGTSVSRSRS